MAFYESFYKRSVHSIATELGKEKGNFARDVREVYKKNTKEKHWAIAVKISAVIIHCDHSYITAFLDAIIRCLCC